MPIINVRSIGTINSRTSLAARQTAYLADGSMVFAFLDVNETDNVDDGGDSTGVSKLYIYHGSANTVSRVWTLKNTITIGPGAANARAEAFSMTIDNAGNLHIAYVTKSDQSVKYIDCAYAAGPVWTPAAAVTAIAAPGAGITHTRVDIDCFGTGSDNPIIVAYRSNTNSTGSTSVAFAVKNNSAAWVANTAWTVTSGIGGEVSLNSDISVAASHEAAPDGTGYHYACITVSGKAVSGDVGHSIRVYQINLTTGASVTSVTCAQGLLLDDRYKMRAFYRGAVSNNKKWVISAWASGAGNREGEAAIITGALGFSVDASMVSTNDLPYASMYNKGNDLSDGSGGHMGCAVTYNKVDAKLLFNWSFAPYALCRIAVLNAASITFRSGYTYATGKRFDASHLRAVQMGNPTSRNCNAACTDFIYNSDQYFWVTWDRVSLNNAISIIKTPDSGATVQVNRPVMTPKYQVLLVNVPPRKVKTQFQLATDAGFTTNLKSITESDAFLETFGSTNGVGIYATGLPFEITESLFQTTWYARSRLVDDFGDVGPWQTLATPYTVTHPPAPANIQPGSGVQVYLFGVPTTCSWEFSDPALPYDSQSAYQLIVERVSDSAIAYDSGKVTSTATSAQTSTISGTYKDTDLRFKVRLWDSDDVAGSYVYSPVTFQLTDAPVPASITPSGTITTGIPTITWSPGLAAGKIQANYRVMVSSSGGVAYDSGWLLGDDTSHLIASGILVNSTSYTVTVMVRDNYGLEGTGTQSITTSFTVPATPTSGDVYLFEYKNRGFVFISVDPAPADADFEAFYLSRRIYGTSTWELIKIWSTLSGRMTHQDFTATPGNTYEYSVTQLVNRFGDLVESNRLTLRTVTPSDDKYWIISESDPTKSFPLHGASDDGYTDEYESETYNVIGRGRHVDFGDRLGLNGSITVKFRDKFTTGAAKVNYAKNPQLNTRTSDNLDPTGWVSENAGTVGTKSIGYVSGNEPAPTGASRCVGVTASGLGTATGDYVGIYQNLARADQPFVAGEQVTFSVWIGGVPAAVNYNLIVVTYNSSAAQLSTAGDLVTLSPSEYYFDTIPASSPDFGSGIAIRYWGRYSRTVTLPANFDNMRVYVRMRGTGSGTAGLTKTLLVTGAQVEKAAAMTPYVDGEQFGGQWRGTEGLSSSETTGYYTARQMKKRLEEFKALRERGYLRTPFGDIYSVSLGNVSLSRIAGVGANEFSDVSIPYTEVSF